MEAPEKIFVQLPSSRWIGRTWNETPIKEGDTRNWKNATNIEYTRTDVVIKKAQNFFRQSHHLFTLDGDELRSFIEDFRKIMKE